MEQNSTLDSASDYAVLHEVTAFGLHEDMEGVAGEALEKAARLFRTRCFAITKNLKKDEIIVSWGFRNQQEVHEKIEKEQPNRFRYRFAAGGCLFMELPYAYDDREARFYTIFARYVERALEHAKAVSEQKQEENLRKHRERILSALATEKPLNQILQFIADSLESEDSDSRAMIMLVDQKNQKLRNWIVPDKVREYIEELPVEVGAGSCGSAASMHQRVIATDIHGHPYWQQYKHIADKVGIRACWSEPVLSASGDILATLGVYYPYPKAPDDEQLERLKTLANLTSIAIERKRSEEQLHKSLKEKEVLLQEVHHRVKNNLALISGFLELQTGINEDPEFIKAVKASQSRIRSMALVHDQLHQVEYITSFRFDQYLNRLVNDISSSFNDPNREIKLELDTHPVNLSIDQAIPCGILLNEMITNTYKHAFSNRTDGLLQVSLHMNSDNDEVCISVKDNGDGMKPEVFENENHSSLGIRIMRNLIRQLNAEYRIENQGGTRITLWFYAENPA